jgi:hypothetical protein
VARCQIVFDARDERVILQEAIQVRQDRLEVETKLRDLGKQILGVVAIA